jgi:hypothetical protein
VVVKRASAAKEEAKSTADLALLYVSQWKTPEAAQRFAEVYKKSLEKRLILKDDNAPEHHDCGATTSPACRALWSSRVNTDEGPVYVEVWPKNLVIVTASFDDETVNGLRQAVLNHVPDGKSKQTASDLSLRLYELPAFRALQERVQRELLDSFARSQRK